MKGEGDREREGEETGLWIESLSVGVNFEYVYHLTVFLFLESQHWAYSHPLPVSFPLFSCPQISPCHCQ